MSTPLVKLGKRKCYLCQQTLALDAVNFGINQSVRGFNGFSFECRVCKRLESKKRRERYRREGKLGLTARRFRVLEKYSFTCQYCGRSAPNVQLQIDHIFPKSLGGLDVEENLTVACVECNIGKSGKDITVGSGK